MDKKRRFETEILSRGGRLKGRRDAPEIPPIFMTTAFNVEDLDDLMSVYEDKGYAYIRNRNPNRNALAELITYLENGHDSLICSSGMAAISTTILSHVEKGDHILSSDTLYGETFDLFNKILPKYGVTVSYADFTDGDAVRKGVRPNTKIIYTESVSNPMIVVVDLEEIGKISAEANALMVVDNTFTTPLAVRPLEWGAHVSINSLTKFANGHSDVVAGSITASSEAITKRIYQLQLLLGCPLDPFSSWLCQRGVRTMDLRVKKQMENAEKLAAALDANPYVRKVNHPSLPSHPQHSVAKRLFDGYGAMMSFLMPDDRGKVNEFLRRLETVHYAMTLGGYRTTLSHPVSSSHAALPQEERDRMGISMGLMRVSVGTESGDDLIGDFNNALEVFA